MNKKAKAEAEKIKERFKEPILVSPEGDVCMTFKTLDDKQAKQCAIIYVNGIIEEIVYSIVILKSTNIEFLEHSNNQIKFYRSILTELENK